MPATRSALPLELIVALESGAWVLTPTERGARTLALTYAKYAISKRRTAWITPSILSFDSFTAQIWRLRGSGLERLLTDRQSQLLWSQCVANSEWSRKLLSPNSAADSSFRSWERLQAWRITRDTLGEFAAQSDETRALLEWSDRFLEQCRRRAWLPQSLLPERLLDANLENLCAAVTVGADFFPNQAALLESIAAAGNPWTKFELPIMSPNVRAARCESPERELKAAAHWSRERLDAGLESVGIAIPNLSTQSEVVRRVFAEVFAQRTRTLTPEHARLRDREIQEKQFAIGGYRRLADFPIVRAALDLLRVAVGRASSTLVGGVLRNPFWRDSVTEASARALVDERLRARVTEHYDMAALARLTQNSNLPVFSELVSIALKLRMNAAPRGTPSQMAEQFDALWRAFGWPGDESLNSEEQQVVARLRNALAEFGALDELLGPLTFATAVREFESQVRSTNYSPRSAASPITIVDQHVATDVTFQALWVCGVDESRWPPPAVPDPFIPIELQIRARMPNATPQLAYSDARSRFDRLQRAADEVVFSWAAKDDDIELLPSAWLREIEPAADVSKLNSRTYAERTFDNKPPLQILTEPGAPAFTIARARGGARIFELQSNCPFRAYAELRLKARPLESVAPNVDARERGTLIHAALADLWEELKGSDALSATTPEQLTVMVRTALSRHAAKLLDGASSHRLRMLQIELDLAAERIEAMLDLDRRRAPFRVVGRPETLENKTIGGLSFELRLDRMDELLIESHHGERVIVDYKTGDDVSVQSWLSERPLYPQLPLYAVTHPEGLAAVTFATITARGVAYKGIARDDDLLPGVKAFDTKKVPAPFSEWPGLLDYWGSVIERLGNEFASGDARVEPHNNACRYCSLSTLCRVNELARIADEEEL